MDYKAALQKCADLCSRQEQCTYYIREKLRLWEVNPEEADKIIEQLTADKFLDDGRYAEYYARDKFHLNGWGKIKISYMLRMKDLREDLINLALAQIDENAYLQTCTALIRSKAEKLTDRKGYARKGKLYRYASGRGFEADIIQRALHLCGEE